MLPLHGIGHWRTANAAARLIVPPWLAIGRIESDEVTVLRSRKDHAASSPEDAGARRAFLNWKIPARFAGQALGLTTNGHDALVGSPIFNPTQIQTHSHCRKAFQLGNVPSTYGYWFGPGFSQWDAALMKEFGLGSEMRRLQLRFEAQNVFNHMNAGNPATGVTNSGFGQIIAQAGNPRQAMVAAKLYF